MTNSETLLCESCSFTTRNRELLNNHIRRKHKTENHQKCPHCDYKYPRLWNVEVHIDARHPENYEKTIPCDLLHDCNRMFILKSSLENYLPMAMARTKKNRKR